MKDSSIANNGSKSYITLIIHVSPPPNTSKQQRRQKKEPDPVTNCSKDDSSLKLQRLTDTRSTQVYPSDLDPRNYCYPNNRSTQTDTLRQRQTVPCCQSSNASQTVSSNYDKPSLRRFSDETTTGNSSTSLGPFSSTSSSSNNSNTAGSCSRSATKAYLNRLMKLKPDYDGPIIHGPFFCDCPGGLDFCKQESLPMHSTDWWSCWLVKFLAWMPLLYGMLCLWWHSIQERHQS